MTTKEIFLVEKTPINGRLANYGKVAKDVLASKDNQAVLAFSGKLFQDCSTYLINTLNLRLPKIELHLLSHKAFIHSHSIHSAVLGRIPETNGFIVGNFLSSSADIYIDLESQLDQICTPMSFVINLCTVYMEELIHSADPKKSETQIQDLLFTAIEGFLEIEVPAGFKRARFTSARTCDEKKKGFLNRFKK